MDKMKVTPIISIIVPVYNVEDYLEKCIVSILRQSFSDFELILVDDGSTDMSGILCDRFAEKDGRIVVIHKKNGGLSSARNAGIDIARGEYLGFVDSDDFIDIDMYQYLYTNLIRENADISMCGIYDCYNGKYYVEKDHYCVQVNVEDAIKITFSDKLIKVTAVNKLYKRSLFSVLRYPINRLMEDVFLILELLLKCERIVIGSEQKYYYIHRENSITSNQFDNRTFDFIRAFKKNYDIIKNNFPNLESIGRYRLCCAYFWVLDRMLLVNHSFIEQEKEIISFLKNNINFILKCKLFPTSRKIAILTLFISKQGYKMLVQIDRKRKGFI